MKATPGCGSIRVWLHFELIFLSLESRAPILLLITALIHNQAHPFPMEWAGKYKKITVGGELLTPFKNWSSLKSYLRIRSLIIISPVILYWSACVYCSFYDVKHFLYQHLGRSVVLWCSFLCLYMTIDWFPRHQEHFTPQLFSLFVFSNRGTSTVDEI